MNQTGTIGIIGGGQLGRMLTEAALPLGFTVIVLDPSPNSPAAQAGATQIVKGYDMESLRELAARVDYLTTEFEEGLEPDALRELAANGVKLNPAPQTIALILDKLDQKNFLASKAIPMGAYAGFETKDEALALLEQYGGKMLIKTRRGGYDGYGNRVVSSSQEIDGALNDFAGKAVYAEAFVPFVKELAVMAARTEDGQIIAYPVAETVQQNNICHQVFAPADVASETAAKAAALAAQVAGQFEGAGMFGVEMFLTDDGEVLLNEIAPRVHNSGHYTIEACTTSQFEQHIRAITGMPLGPTAMKVPSAVMVNILGERNGDVELSGVEEAEADPQVKVHIYGKSPTKIGRKMGHLTATGDTLEEAKERANRAMALIKI